MRALVLLILLSVTVAACGVKGPLELPEGEERKTVF